MPWMRALPDQIWRILLVEDSPLDTELALTEIAAKGLRVEHREVDNEDAMVKALDDFGPDLILSDLSMPNFSGYRALELHHEHLPDVPFIFLSGTIGEQAAIDALRQGATDYVLKHNLSRLVPAIARALVEARERAARDSAEQELLRAQRSTTLGLLVGGLSHDLRNALQPLLMAAENLKDRNDPELAEIADLVKGTALRGLDMVKAMLGFARGNKSLRKRTTSGDLLTALIALLKANIPRHTRLSVDGAHDLEIEVNVTEVHQCLLNLCLNGLQAMPDGGDLQISVNCVTLGDDFFECSNDPYKHIPGSAPPTPGEYVEFAIRDSGVGMSEEVKEKLFRPFFTTKNDGTGLGLLSCKRIIDEHRGYLRLESVPGDGATFRIYFPVAEPIDTDAAQSLVGSQARILICTYDSAALRPMIDRLTSAGCEVFLMTADGKTPGFDGSLLPDVIVMDHDLRFADSTRILGDMTERGYVGALILLVTPGQEPLHEDFPPLRGIQIVPKPVDDIVLIAAIQKALRS